MRWWLAILSFLVLLVLSIKVFKRMKTKEAVCGHRTKLRGTIKDKKGEKRAINVPFNPEGRPKYCLNCLSEMTIRCPRCDRAIFIEDPVSLYYPSEIDYRFLNKKIYVTHTNNPWSLVACLNCTSVNEKVGIWSSPGKLRAI